MTNLSKTFIAAFVIFGSLVTSPAFALVQHQWWMEKWFCTDFSTPGQSFPRVKLTHSIVADQTCEGGGCTARANGGAVLYSRPEGRDITFSYEVLSANQTRVNASDEADGGNTFLDLRKNPAVGNLLQMTLVETIEGKAFTYSCQTQSYKLIVRKPGNLVVGEVALPRDFGDAISWRPLPGRARDIGVGADGSVWIIGTKPIGAAGDFGIYKFIGNNWAGVNGGAVRIAVGPNGVPWIVNSAGQIFRREGDAWKPLPGRAKDIGVGADGSVWIVGTKPIGAAGDFGIYKLTGANWTSVDGGGVRIAVGPDGMPWIVNSAGQIFRRNGNSWKGLPGRGRDIGIGPNSSAWLVGTDRVGNAADFGIYGWDGASWKKSVGGGTGISVGPNAVPWIVNSAGSIFKLG